MVWNDIATGLGIVQGCEAECGLGATAISGNTALFKDFTRWANQWNKTLTAIALMNSDGADVDDPAYTTLPSGTITGTTNRDYNIDSAYKMLKIKLLNVTYDGTNYVPATPFDGAQRLDIALKDPNVDGNFSSAAPQYDLIANGFKLFPKFTSAQVSAGAKVYVEWYRTPREFATSGTDSYEPGIDTPFHVLVQKGASWEYAKLYKPELARSLMVDIYGNGSTVKGLLTEMKDWYRVKQPSTRRMTAFKQNNK